MKNFAVFVSGSGTNLQTIISAVNKGEITANLALVICDKKDAYALKRAEKAGIKTLFINPKDFSNRQSFDRQVAIHLRHNKVDFIVLAGYMRLLSPFFVKAYKQKILNVHPSLLPSFKGARGIKDAYTYGVKVTGVTIHFVTEKMDHGPIILQEGFKISERDTLETIEERIHKIEHKIYPKAIQLFVEGRLKVKRRRVEISEQPAVKPQS